jgi:threonine synthase
MLMFECAGCGAELVPCAAAVLPFACPNARREDDIDHVVRRAGTPASTFPAGDAANPFIRYRPLLAAHALALECGVGDEAFVALVRELDAAVAAVDGGGFEVTPFGPSASLAAKIGLSTGELWVKDETGNVSGSHKARHLMGLMLYLLVHASCSRERRGGAIVGRGSEGARRLAIASCGNAALAAGVIARAAGWPLDVFVPPSAAPSVLERLNRLSAAIHTCDRLEGVSGDPCYAAFRSAVAAGAIPFCCQGSDNGLTIEGGKTLPWEMISAVSQPAAGADDDRHIDAMFVQVGGGALASAVIQGLADAVACRAIARLPRFYTVQTTGAYPLKRAYDTLAERILRRVPAVVEHGFLPASDRERADLMANWPGFIEDELRYARHHRSAFMRPWEKTPHSVAHGILDDETYDWAAVVEGMLKTGGWPLVVGEDLLLEANTVAREATGVNVDHTGSAGLAGAMKAVTLDARLATERVAVIFSGVSRTA